MMRVGAQPSEARGQHLVFTHTGFWSLSFCSIQQIAGVYQALAGCQAQG